MLAVYKKELRAYFTSMIGWVFIAFMLVLVGLYFMVYNLVGGAIWVSIFCYAGYLFGDLPFVQENLKLLIVAIIFISILPAIIEVLRAKLKS